MQGRKGGTKKRKTAASQLAAALRSYGSRSTVHGLTYIVEDRNVWERLAWLLVVLIMVALGSLIVRTSIEEWYNNPVMTTTVTNSMPIQKVHLLH